MAGPTINPIPKIAPKSQKLLVRSFWSTAISLKIDWIELILPPAKPLTILATKYIRTFHEIRRIIKLKKLENTDTPRIGFLQNLSDNAPKIGVDNNANKEYKVNQREIIK